MRSLHTRRCVLSALLALCMLSLIACDDDGTSGGEGAASAGAEVAAGAGAGGSPEESGQMAGEEPDEPDEPVFGEIEATVNYSGALMGQLIVGVFPEVPPTSPPVSFKIINEPVFPQSVTLDFVEEGDWYVFAFLDAEPLNSQSPSETDPQGNSALINVMGEQVNAVSFELTDP